MDKYPIALKLEWKEWFDLRLINHIHLVRKYGEKLSDECSFLNMLKMHDYSKFKSPEYYASVLIAWRYLCKGLNQECEFDLDPEVKVKIDKITNIATLHHMTTSRHHPEYWVPISTDPYSLLNLDDRDGLPPKIIDATAMPDISILEMVADWAAMSKEKNNSLKAWIKKNVNIRWKFNEHQVETINNAADILKMV